MKRALAATAAVACLTLWMSPARAANTPTATEIIERVLARDAFGWEGALSHVRMILEKASGKKQERLMEIRSRAKGKGSQTLVRFMSPKEVAGTAFLMLDHGKKGDSEQYIYLPGLRRTRRIAGREREGSFMGSEFTYADFQRRDIQQATHKRLDDDKIGEHETYVVESAPKPSVKSSYSKVKSWIRKSDHVPLRTRFYDQKGKLLKTLYARKIRDIKGQPVIVEARMENEQNGAATDLVLQSMERRESFEDTSFTPNALERM